MLFGHQNDDTNVTPPADLPPPPQPVSDPTDTPVPGVNPLAVDPDTGVSLPVAPIADATDDTPASEPTILDQPVSDETTPSAPVVAPEAPTMFEPEADADATDLSTTSAESSSDTSEAEAAPLSDALLALKQKALSDLSPLVGKLDQTPEEKFRTTMMLIQSTDDQSLLQGAYEAALAISDEKARAQALLDVVNEINYFAQQKQS